MNNKTIILISGAAQHGKDSLCSFIRQELENHHRTSVRIAYADYLKHLAKVLFNWNGEKDILGRTLLQTVGTRAREKDKNFWVSIVEQTISTVVTEDFVIIPDTRYPNEITYLKERGYNVVTVKVERPGFDNGLTDEQKSHSSENALADFVFDFTVVNTTYEGLKAQAQFILREIGG